VFKNDKATVTEITNLLSDKEINMLIQKRKRFYKSRTAAGVSTSRTSSTSQLDMHDPFIKCLKHRIEALFGSRVGELELTRYRNHQYFKPHTDPYEEDKMERFQTIFLYLTDVPQECGGKTIFPKLFTNGRVFKVRPRKGTALFWNNLTDGEINENLLHASTPMTCRGKTKIGLNVWLEKTPPERENTFYKENIFKQKLNSYPRLAF